MIAVGSLVVLDEEMGAAVHMDPQEELDNFLLQLPSHAGNASRTVPGGCAICLCPYEEGDVVSWSTETACKHAFHQGKRRYQRLIFWWLIFGSRAFVLEEFGYLSFFGGVTLTGTICGNKCLSSLTFFWYLTACFRHFFQNPPKTQNVSFPGWPKKKNQNARAVVKIFAR
jgi:hypothetical protein